METIFETYKFIIRKNTSGEYFISSTAKAKPETTIRFYVIDNRIRFTTNGKLIPIAYHGTYGFELEKI